MTESEAMDTGTIVDVLLRSRRPLRHAKFPNM